MKAIRGMTDDEAIATAMLLGCEFWSYKYYGDGVPYWHVHDDGENLHPVEQARHNKTGKCYWRNKAALAREFVEWHLKEAKRER